jgi:hypothetical protein
VFKNGPPWLVMFTTRCTPKCSTLQFATRNLHPQKLCVSCGKNWIRWCSSLVLQTPISKGSWWIMHMPIGMLYVSCTRRCLYEDGWQGTNLLVPLDLVAW